MLITAATLNFKIIIFIEKDVFFEKFLFQTKNLSSFLFYLQNNFYDLLKYSWNETDSSPKTKVVTFCGLTKN